MKVSEFIEWMKTQDQDAIVEVVVGGHRVEFTEPSEQSEYCDFRGNQFVKETAHYYNKRYIMIGSTD